MGYSKIEHSLCGSDITLSHFLGISVIILPIALRCGLTLSLFENSELRIVGAMRRASTPSPHPFSPIMTRGRAREERPEPLVSCTPLGAPKLCYLFRITVQISSETALMRTSQYQGHIIRLFRSAHPIQHRRCDYL